MHIITHIYERLMLISCLSLKIFKFWKCVHFQENVHILCKLDENACIFRKYMHFMQIRWKCVHFMQIRWKCMHFQGKTLPSRVTFISWHFSGGTFSVADPGGCCRHVPPLHVHILSFWHTNFLKRSYLRSWHPPMRSVPPYRKSWIRDWFCCIGSDAGLRLMCCVNQLQNSVNRGCEWRSGLVYILESLASTTTASLDFPLPYGKCPLWSKACGLVGMWRILLRNCWLVLDQHTRGIWSTLNSGKKIVGGEGGGQSTLNSGKKVGGGKGGEGRGVDRYSAQEREL